jgi:hypothetical protein
MMTPYSVRVRFPNIQKEVRRSLKTTNRQEAQRLAIALYMQTTMDFQTTLENVDTIDEALILASGLLTIQSNLPSAESKELLETFHILIEDNKSLLERRFLKDISPEERKCLESLGSLISRFIRYDFDSEAGLKYFPFYSDKIKEIIEKLLIRIERATNSHLVSIEPAIAAQPQIQICSFSKVCDEFVSERLAGGNWQSKTQQAYEVTFQLFIGIFGDIPITKIDASMCRDFKSNIQKFPKNHSKDTKYRKLSVPELL